MRWQQCNWRRTWAKPICNHYKIFKQYADSLRSLESERMATRLQAEFDFSKKELEFQRKSLQQRWLIISAFASLLVLIAIVWLVNRNRKREHRSNVLLQRKNIDIENQKSIAEKTLEELKAAQQQLVQHEKMASLGELTAGIAHEIQNPLNFVNNFSALNQELLAEMKEEIANQNYNEVVLLAANVEANEDKIAHHGKRADSIIKSMLMHSRGSTSGKEPTDINALADEFLRLSYHGLRAKDKSFNATLKTDYDPGIGKVQVSAQEMGRVLLNLYNNAFYAVDEKKKRGDVFEPTVSVRTKKDGNRIFVFVCDNGVGIPQSVAEKIFQPFYTTKPTGQGTGLGLSMSYDIVTKQHGGELSVQSNEGEGAEFKIELPVV
ncbi:MAG: two-component sensor histidine kinase [Chitinophagaceae bacterium]|nr:MAG: two-component sensor histidine kinase [Chitinophagaceae bacterium]